MAVVKTRRAASKRRKSRTVVLSRRRYERLMEDLHDLAVVAERRTQSTLTSEELHKKLRRRGLL